MKHTPGPLSVAKQLGPADCDSFNVLDQLSRTVARCEALPNADNRPGSPYTPETAEANAYLIAAAPDLLQALEEFLVIDDWHDNTIAPLALVARARAAVAKAKGAF